MLAQMNGRRGAECSVWGKSWHFYARVLNLNPAFTPQITRHRPQGATPSMRLQSFVRSSRPHRPVAAAGRPRRLAEG